MSSQTSEGAPAVLGYSLLIGIAQCGAWLAFAAARTRDPAVEAWAEPALGAATFALALLAVGTLIALWSTLPPTRLRTVVAAALVVGQWAIAVGEVASHTISAAGGDALRTGGATLAGIAVVVAASRLLLTRAFREHRSTAGAVLVVAVASAIGMFTWFGAA